MSRIRATMFVVMVVVVISCGIGLRRVQVLRRSEVPNLTVTQRGRIVTITGGTFHSALGIAAVTQERRAEELTLRVYVAPALSHATSDFRVDVAVPGTVTVIRFGDHDGWTTVAKLFGYRVAVPVGDRVMPLGGAEIWKRDESGRARRSARPERHVRHSPRLLGTTGENLHKSYSSQSNPTPLSAAMLTISGANVEFDPEAERTWESTHNPWTGAPVP